MLTNVAEVRAAVIQVTGVANRTLSIMTHDLEPDVYDHDDFLETLKKFILARTFARVRVLILEPARVVLSASRFVAMGRRLNSYIEFRRVTPDLAAHPEAFFIADEQALVYRARAESWDGMSDTYEPAVARMYLTNSKRCGTLVKSNPKYANFKYSRPMTRGIDVTVAAIIERDGKFLMVEERAGDRLVLNQPAGHLEQGESLLAAVVRETLEETGHRFEAEHVVGFYLWRSEDADTTYLRIAFCGDVEPTADVAALDDGIVAVHWLSRTQLLRRAHQLRSPMVLRCLDDYLRRATLSARLPELSRARTARARRTARSAEAARVEPGLLEFRHARRLPNRRRPFGRRRFRRRRAAAARRGPSPSSACT